MRVLAASATDVEQSIVTATLQAAGQRVDSACDDLAAFEAVKRFPVWDRAVWRQLVDMLGEERMLHHMGSFLAQAASVADALPTDCDRPRLQSLIHDLKSIAGVFGFKEVAGTCHAIEIAWFEGVRPPAGLVAAIERALAAARGGTVVAQLQ